MAFMRSCLISRGYMSEEFTEEDIRNLTNYKVSNRLTTLYIDVIKMLSVGKSYEEIIEYVDNYSSSDYDALEDSQKVYVKNKAKKDLMRRKMSFERGEDNNE